MDTLHVPYLQSGDSIRTALDRLWETKTKAVIVQEGKENVLYTGDDLMKLYKEGAVNLSEITPGTGANVVDLIQHQNDLFDDVFTDNREISRSTNNYLQNIITRTLDKKNLKYGMMFFSWEKDNTRITTLITRHERFKNEIMAQRAICRCTGPAHHLEHDKSLNGKGCNDCEYTYECY